MSGPRFCGNCGASVPSEANFCLNCGRALRGISYPQPSAATGRLGRHSMLGQRYRILGQLGRGGMGAVYKAEDTRLGNVFRAIKELGQQGLDQQELQKAIGDFQREAILLAGLEHPNLPRVYDHFSEDGHWYLVMDYIDGETLEDLLDETDAGKFPLEKVLAIAVQLCSVLDYLHTRQPPVIFRDLKPANIMLTSGGQVYLIDFGIARLFKPGQRKDTIALGSPGYAAPEQHGRAQTTPRADIYSLGATLHHLLSGSDPSLHPFRFEALGLMDQQGGPELEALLMQMVEMDADKRPPSALAVKQELERIMQLPAGLSKQPPQPALQRPSSRPGAVVSQQGGQPVMPGQMLKLSASSPVIVSKQGDGHYTSIGEAIQNVAINTRILVRPGTYEEGLILDTEVEIIGDGPVEQIVIKSEDAPCLLMQSGAARVQGLTLRCQAKLKSEQLSAVDIPAGQLVLTDCDIASGSPSVICIAIHGSGALPVIRKCKIHDGQHGIYVSDEGQGVIEDCDIFGHIQPAVVVKKAGNPTLRRCKIHDGKDAGVLVQKRGQGLLEECDIFGNALMGVEIKESGNPTLRRCKIHEGKDAGVLVHTQGQVVLEECNIFGNALAGVVIAEGGNATIRTCKIYEGKDAGVYIHTHSHGLLEDCDIFANTESEVVIREGGTLTLRRCQAHEGKNTGIQVHGKGLGMLEDCDIFGNTGIGATITEEGYLTMKRCKVHHGKDAGLLFSQKGQGILEDCDIFSNTKAGVVITERGTPTLRRCNIHEGQDAGVFVHKRGKGVLESCEIGSNAFSGVAITEAGNPTIQGCRINHNKHYAVSVYNKGQGTIVKCNVSGNKRGAWNIEDGCQVQRSQNRTW